MYIYIYIYTSVYLYWYLYNVRACVCVCVCVFVWEGVWCLCDRVWLQGHYRYDRKSQPISAISFENAGVIKEAGVQLRMPNGTITLDMIRVSMAGRHWMIYYSIIISSICIYIYIYVYICACVSQWLSNNGDDRLFIDYLYLFDLYQ